MYTICRDCFRLCSNTVHPGQSIECACQIACFWNIPGNLDFGLLFLGSLGLLENYMISTIIEL